MGPKARTVKFYSTVSDRSEVIHLISRLFNSDGGPGSGNFGHSGRPGKVGGSGKGGGVGGNASSESSSSVSNSPSTSYHSLRELEPGETVNIFELLGQSEENRQSEAKSAESARKSFERLAKSYHMQGISKAAKEHKGDYKGFVNSLSRAQKDAIVEQHRACGTKEPFTDYVKRMQDMLASEETPPPPKNEVVQGKDITADYSYKGRMDSGKAGSEEIDTQIEDVIHQQGFDGVPKIVSKEEFDRITSEHPEVPVLFRAFTAENADSLSQYNADLEGGHWYVDCGVGGAQYGQGMYCAGVYRKNSDEEVYQWDDPSLDVRMQDIFVFKKGDQGYVAEEVHPEESMDMYFDQPYMVVDDAGNKRLIQQDSDSFIWTDIGKGGILSDEEVDELCKTHHIYKCREMDVSVYEKNADEEFQKALRGASAEMDHYLNFGIMRIKENGPAMLPEGKSAVEDTSTDSYFYYDSKEISELADKKPKDGDIVVLTSKNGNGPSMYWYKDGEFISVSTPDAPRLSEQAVQNTRKWAPVEGRVESFNPQGSVRKMTLDPSAKIITYDELDTIMDGGLTYDEEKDATTSYFDEKTKDLGIDGDSLEYMKYRYGLYRGYEMGTYSKKCQEIEKKLDPGEKKMLDTVADDLKANSWGEAITPAMTKAHERARNLRNKFADMGSLAAALGYDAINAQGHGESMSYTVVLNRTKVILQKEAA